MAEHTKKFSDPKENDSKWIKSTETELHISITKVNQSEKDIASAQVNQRHVVTEIRLSA